MMHEDGHPSRIKKSKIKNQKLKTKNQQSKTKSQKSKIRNQTLNGNLQCKSKIKI